MKKATSKKATSKKATSKKAVTKKATSKKVVPKKVAGKKVVTRPPRKKVVLTDAQKALNKVKALSIKRNGIDEEINKAKTSIVNAKKESFDNDLRKVMVRHKFIDIKHGVDLLDMPYANELYSKLIDYLCLSHLRLINPDLVDIPSEKKVSNKRAKNDRINKAINVIVNEDAVVRNGIVLSNFASTFERESSKYIIPDTASKKYKGSVIRMVKENDGLIGFIGKKLIDKYSSINSLVRDCMGKINENQTGQYVRPSVNAIVWYGIEKK